MAVLRFKPTKARVIVSDDGGSVLVMRVVLASDESVLLTTGGGLEELSGVLRIRERPQARGRAKSSALGNLVFVPGAPHGSGDGAAKFQINMAIDAGSFATLLRAAMHGRLPARFFIDAGTKVSSSNTRGLGYTLRAGQRKKVWDNRGYRSLPITAFSSILPIETNGHSRRDFDDDTVSPAVQLESSSAVSSELAQIADDLATYQGETRHALIVIAAAVGVIFVLMLIAMVVLMFR